MRFIFLFALFVFIQFTGVCQKGDFPFSQITFKELEMTSYARDTNANAVILKEYGFARINHEFKVIFQYHAKIKILKKGGLSNGDFVIPIYSNNSSDETGGFPCKPLLLTSNRIPLRSRSLILEI